DIIDIILVIVRHLFLMGYGFQTLHMQHTLLTNLDGCIYHYWWLVVGDKFTWRCFLSDDFIT
ncbi:hypothetical protein MKW98_022074, partial [Papaver atlanticum]